MRRTILKIVLVLAALGLTLMLFLWPEQTMRLAPLTVPPPEAPVDAETPPSLSDVGSTTMIEPRFSGEDSKNRRWEISAKSARQTGGENQEEITLEEVKASATIKEGKPLSFSAGKGKYSRAGEMVELGGGVTVEGMGFTLKTDAVTSDLKNRTAKGDSSVTISTDTGSLTAPRFEIEGNGTKVKMTGGVKAVFYPPEPGKKKADK